MIFFSAVLLTCMICMSVLNLATVLHLEDEEVLGEEDEKGGAGLGPKVSLLIPARNESYNLMKNLPLLVQANYSNLEILILDDESSDRSFELLEFWKAQYPELLYVYKGEPLPEGWVGKSWACYQLYQKSTGEILIFCDADVQVGPDAISKSVHVLKEYSLDLLSLFPRQQMKTMWEKALIPFVLIYPLSGLLPLRFLDRMKKKETIIANGQWMCIRRDKYQKINHETIKKSIIEDVDLARAFKKAGYSIMVALATHELTVRMYKDLKSIREGFSKNLYALVSGKPVWAICYLFCHYLTMILPWKVALSMRAFGLESLFLLFIFLFLSLSMFRADLSAMLYQPLGALYFPFLCLESLWKYSFGKTVWKGRSYNLNDTSEEKNFSTPK